MVLTDNVAETGQFAGLQLQTEQVGHIPEGCQDPDQLPGIILHAGNAHLYPAYFTAFSCDAQVVFPNFNNTGCIFTELTTATTKWMSECVMAIFANHLLPVISGYPFSFLIEEKNAPIQIVSNNSLLEAVQNMFQIVTMAH